MKKKLLFIALTAFAVNTHSASDASSKKHWWDMEWTTKASVDVKNWYKDVKAKAKGAASDIAQWTDHMWNDAKNDIAEIGKKIGLLKTKHKSSEAHSTKADHAVAVAESSNASANVKSKAKAYQNATKKLKKVVANAQTEISKAANDVNSKIKAHLQKVKDAHREAQASENAVSQAVAKDAKKTSKKSTKASSSTSTKKKKAAKKKNTKKVAKAKK